jgi:hypothetical protein
LPRGACLGRAAVLRIAARLPMVTMSQPDPGGSGCWRRRGADGKLAGTFCRLFVAWHHPLQPILATTVFVLWAAVCFAGAASGWSSCPRRCHYSTFPGLAGWSRRVRPRSRGALAGGSPLVHESDAVGSALAPG